MAVLFLLSKVIVGFAVPKEQGCVSLLAACRNANVEDAARFI